MKWYENLCVCFGLRCAPWIFTQVSNLVVKLGVRHGYGRCVNYLDDFLVVDGSYADCAEAQKALIAMLGYLGFIVAWKKVCSPTREIKFLGIIIDTVNMTLSIGDDKLERVKAAVLYFEGRRWCSRKRLEKLAGLLAHCSTVVKGGRTFSRRIYNVLKHMPREGRRVKLSDQIRLDFDWWAKFVNWFNGKARMVVGAGKVNHVYTDVSRYGFGGHWERDFFHGVWDRGTCSGQRCCQRCCVYVNVIKYSRVNETPVCGKLMLVCPSPSRLRNIIYI